MPELPEVEVTRRGLAGALVGARIEAVALGKPLRWPLGCDPGILTGQQVVGLRRRGKYLLADTSEGLLLLHLGMSGSLRFDRAMPEAGAHDHFDLVTDRGVLRLHDPRRFGAVVYAQSEDDPAAVRLLSGLGVEPLSEAFSPELFYAGLQRSGLAIKQLLLSGRLVVGVGNIYASEALYMARVRPTTKASGLGPVRARRLHAAIREVLSQAVAMGGSTLRDFSGVDGTAGHFQSQALVYGRDGEPCLSCGTPIRLLRQGQRSTYFCPTCQRR